MNHLKSLAFAVLALSLSACESVDVVKDSFTGALNTISDISVPLPSTRGDTGRKLLSDKLMAVDRCPAVEVVDDLHSYYDFTNISKATRESLVSRAELFQMQNSCSYAERSTTVDLQFAFKGQIGPAGRQGGGDSPSFSYPYFVAVMSPSGQVLAKEIFAVSLTYGNHQDEQTHYESLRQIIPSYSQANGAGHKIVIGFQLSKEQLELNRTLMERMDKAKAASLIQQRKQATGESFVSGRGQEPPPAAAIPAAVPPPVQDNGPIALTPDKKLNP